MKACHLPRLFCVVVSVLFCLPARAQAPLEPTQMPVRTAAYLIWRGAPAGDPRKANSLLALWDDPAFAPVRAAMFENMNAASSKEPAKGALTRDEAEQYSALLENAFVIGYISKPETQTSASAAPSKSAAKNWNGVSYIGNRARIVRSCLP